MQKNILKIRNENAFTIVELMVALSLFAAAIGLVVGVFVQALRTQRMVNNLISVNSNGSLLIEQIAREIRAGYDFQSFNFSSASVCNDTPSSGEFASYDTLLFTRFRGDSTTTVAYGWNETSKSIDRTEGLGFPESLTAENIAVSRLCFVREQPSCDSPPRITILMSLGSKNTAVSGNQVNLQTSVSARILPEEIGTICP